MRLKRSANLKEGLNAGAPHPPACAKNKDGCHPGPLRHHQLPNQKIRAQLLTGLELRFLSWMAMALALLAALLLSYINISSDIYTYLHAQRGREGYREREKGREGERETGSQTELHMFTFGAAVPVRQDVS